MNVQNHMRAVKSGTGSIGGASRRQVLRSLAGAALLGGAAAALGGCESKPTAVGATAGDGPEKPDLRFGMIALTDCSPIVIAHEKGFFKKYGINATIDKKANWRSIYDSLATGDIHGTHMLIGMPIASTLGLIGQKVPMVIPWLLNRNGQSISLTKDLRGKVQADPKVLKPFVDAAKAKGKPLSFAMTFPPGTHAMWIRYWLAEGGINPDKDMDLGVVPPASMFANIQSGSMAGCCVGEPWNAKMVNEDVGFTALNTQDIWEDHPEKVCAFREDFAA
ncbi:MAG TPA: CmpA/NrtA family ABC transporter substrate-binding protein, partial [Tepidisphaeraceae bacterium]|nr:CmpA/NrtA family ABC transporter substrate-binding protein [Tepidisphaeraceae bacterium]